MQKKIAMMSHDQLTEIAQKMVKGKLLGCNSVEQAVGLMLIAQAEGKHPATVAKEYHIINGKPALSAEAMLARFQAAGGSIEWITKSDTECSAKFSHPLGKCEITWNTARAKQAELRSPTWKKYPQQMLSARVVSEGVRSCFPDCIEGFYVVEEQEDIPPAKAEVIEMPLKERIAKISADDLLVRIDEATNEADLKAMAEDAKTLPDDDKARVRDAYRMKRDELNHIIEGELVVQEQN